MALTGAAVREALAAVGAVGRQLRSFDELAAGATAALWQAPPGLTVQGAAAFLATCAVESAYFRTTVEYGTGQRYAPFVGRTFVQLTWEANYRGFGRWCHGRGLVADPEVFVRDPVQLGAYAFAWLGPVYYFGEQRLWEWANAGEFLRVSQAVNGGRSRAGTRFVPNGWRERDLAYRTFLRAGAALLPGAPSPTARPTASTPEEFLMALTDAEQRELLDGVRKLKPGVMLPGRGVAVQDTVDDHFGWAMTAAGRAADALVEVRALRGEVAALRSEVAALRAGVPAAGVDALGAFALTFTGTATAAPTSTEEIR